MSVTLTFNAPEKLVKAAKMICEQYNYPLESFLCDALRYEIDRNAHDNFNDFSYTIRKDFSKEVLTMIDD